MSQISDAHDMGRLLAFALRPKNRPGAGGEYGALVTRYRDDVTFRSAFDALVDGMDIPVGHASDLGLYLNPRRESVFAYRVSDESATWNNEQARALRGIAHLGVAAYAYPHPDDLHDPSIKYVDVMHLVAFLRRAVDELRSRADAVAEGGGEVDDIVQLALTAGVDTAWSHWEKLPDVEIGSTGRGARRISRSCTTFWVLRALKELTDWGLAKQVGKDSDGRFQLLERFRIQVGQYAVEEGYRALAALRRVDPQTPDARAPGDPIPLPGDAPRWATSEQDDDFRPLRGGAQPLAADLEEQA